MVILLLGNAQNPFVVNNEIKAPYPNPADHRSWSPWNSTLAPGGNWKNYIRTGTLLKNGSFPALTLNSTIYHPYVPGLLSYITYKVSKANGGGYNNKQLHAQAGVDCIGFVQRSASYTGNNYKLKDYVNENWNAANITYRHDDHKTYDIGHDNYSWEIKDRNLLVPGDILYRKQPTGDDTRGERHVAFVLRVEYPNENKRKISIDEDTEASKDVYVIEATGIKNYYKVVNSQNWLDLKSGYSPRRFIINK